MVALYISCIFLRYMAWFIGLIKVFKEYVVQMVPDVFQDSFESFRIFYDGFVVIRFVTECPGGLVVWEIPGYQFLRFGMEVLEICLGPIFYGWTGCEGDGSVFLENVRAYIFEFCFRHYISFPVINIEKYTPYVNTGRGILFFAVVFGFTVIGWFRGVALVD